VISLGDTIKFSLSPSKSKDRLSTNVQGVPVDGRNLVRRLSLFCALWMKHYSNPLACVLLCRL